MAYYLVRAKPKPELIIELKQLLEDKAFEELQPFGRSLTLGLENARIDADGTAHWEEEDYCSPPLAQERKVVLDRYFEELQVETVGKGEGWKRVENLPRLFSGLLKENN